MWDITADYYRKGIRLSVNLEGEETGERNSETGSIFF